MEDDNKRPSSWLRHVVWLDEVPAHLRAAEEAAIDHQHHAPVIIENIALPQHHSPKIYLAGGVATIMVVIVGWLLCSVFLAQTNIGNLTKPARSNDKQLAAAINQQTKAYKLTIKYPDGQTKQYSLPQIGLKVDTAASVKSTQQRQHQLSNRLKWWQPIEAVVVIRQEGAFSNFVASQTNVIVQPSQDASLSIVNGDIKLTDAVTGKQYGLPKSQQTVLAASRSLRPQVIKLQTLKVDPALTAAALEPYKASLEKTINQPVTFTVANKTIKATPSDIADWLEITPDDKSKKVDITVNSGKVLAYINKATAAYVYPPKAQIEVDQPDGSRQVLVAGVSGVDVTNKSAVASEVAKNLQAAKGIALPLSVNYASFQTITAGLYDKWIEVDLANKRMYAYEKDNLVNTELVTAGAPSTPTVTGQYAIYAKFAQQDMRGNNVDGSKYFQPHVRWINYFYKDYAIHGNYWRPLSYFGNINSSHGCVSLVDSEAEWIYDWAPIGTPVIVHT